MSPYRFSIRGMMTFVVLAAMAFAALRTPTRLWANAWYTMALVGVTIAMPAAVATRDGRRLFWLGFAVCGGVYFLFALTPWLEDQASYRLLTTTVLDLISSSVVDKSYLARTYIPAFQPPSTPGTPTPWQVWNLSEPDATRWRHGYAELHAPFLYFRVGHAAFCVLIAMAGGELTRYLGRARVERSAVGGASHPVGRAPIEPVPFLLPDRPGGVDSRRGVHDTSPPPSPPADDRVRI
jgi:hypothetical protein